MRKRDHDGWESQLFQEPMLGAGGEEARNFVRFNCTMFLDGKRSQVVGFAHPLILFELGGTKLHGFVDATFDVVPHPFSQVLVIMLYFSKYDLYVPAYYVLMTVSYISPISISPQSFIRS